jgi:hypothetical protein
MVDTKKFSEFDDGGDIPNDTITVGLGSGGNTKYNNPWTFLTDGTTAGRPTPSPTINYRLRFNTTTRRYEYYDGVDLAWVQLAEDTGNVTSITGTIHQIIASSPTGNVTLSTPQDIDTTSTPNFNALILTTALNPAYGGTGVQNPGTSTLTLAGPLRGIGNFAANFTFTNTTNVTFPTSGTLATTAGTVSSIQGTANQVLVNGLAATPTTGAITLTTPQDIATTSDVTFNSATLTAPLALTSGGTNASLTASNGGIVYSTASAMAILAGTSTAQRLLMSGASTTPQWSTTTYPLTNAINTIMYTSSANVMGVIAAANSSVLVTSATGVPSMSGAMTNGQLIIGSTGATPTVSTLTAGTGITITNAAASITISGSGSGYSWTEVTGTSQSMAVNNGYIANNVALVTLTLPITASIGDTVILQGKGAGLFKIAQNSGQTIRFGNVSTTTGVGGSLTAISQYNSIELLCITANTDWAVLTGTQGSFTVV